jgi:hypothetical protein
MDTTLLIAIGIAVIALGLAAWFWWQMHSRHKLKDRFGPEYDRAVRDYGSESKAVSALGKREERTRQYTIRALSERERQEFETRWRDTQACFVDDPRAAAREADALVNRLMEARGYPMTDFDHRAEDVSVDHPHVVQNYRTAHAIALADSAGKASTEDLRRAFVCYRALFSELLETQSTPTGREVHA